MLINGILKRSWRASSRAANLKNTVSRFAKRGANPKPRHGLREAYSPSRQYRPASVTLSD
jgi:hypothetical protein